MCRELIRMKSGACHSLPLFTRMLWASFFIRVCLLLDVEDIPEGQVGRAVILEPAEKDLAIVQEDSLVFGGKFKVPAAARRQQGREQAEKQDGVVAPDATVTLLLPHNPPPESGTPRVRTQQ